MAKVWTFAEWHCDMAHKLLPKRPRIHTLFFYSSLPKESVQAEQSKKGSRWDKHVSSGYILKSGITLAVWWCFQNTLSSLQHLIKGLLIFSWWSQPSQHLAAGNPPSPFSCTTQPCQETHKLASNRQTCPPSCLSPMNPVNKVSFKCPWTKPEEGGTKTRGKL